MTAAALPDKERVALISLFASGGLLLAKLVVASTTGSLGVLSEAVHSGMDLAATAITWFAVRAADLPADDKHPYGHAKFESVAAFVQCGLLVGAAGWIAMEALRRLVTGESEVEASWIAAAVLLVSVGVDFWRSRALSRAADAHGSHALAADALHFASDMLSSIVVLASLGLVALGVPAADAIAALVVAGFVARAAWRLGSRTFDVLVDAAPSGLAERIAAAAAIPGVHAVEQVRARPAGSTVFADLSVTVDRALPQERVAEIKAELGQAVAAAVPNAQVTVSTSPVARDDETIATRVRLLAARQGLDIHHLTIQQVEGRLSVSLDLELDGGLTLGDAHGLATRFEQAVEADLGGEVEVDTHIEPLAPDPLDGRDAAEDLRAAIEASLARFAAEAGGLVRHVHSVRARETRDGLVVNFHAGADSTLTVRAAHEAMDAVERRLRRAHPTIVRVVGHAEPISACSTE